MTDNRTTKLRISEPLRGFIRHQSNRAYIDGGQASWLTKIADGIDAKHEQKLEAATLGSDDGYEAKMDELLCRLTNGKWSKSRAYGIEFMVSCIDEEYEKAYAGESDREAELEELVRDWQELYENPDYGEYVRLTDRTRKLGIEVER